MQKCVLCQMLTTKEQISLLHSSMHRQSKLNEPHHEKKQIYEKTKTQISFCEADQRLCFRYMDSTISLLSKSKISRLKFVSGLVGNPQDRFCRDKAHISHGSDQDHLSLVARKPAFCICENKDADQLRGDREADQRLYFRYTESTTPLLPKSEISSL